MKNCAAAKIFAHLCLSPPSLLLALPQLVPLHPRLLCLAHSGDCGNIAVSLIVIFKVILISIENRDFKKTNSRLTVVYLDLLRAGAGRGAGWRAAARRTRRRAPRRRPQGRRRGRGSPAEVEMLQNVIEWTLQILQVLGTHRDTRHRGGGGARHTRGLGQHRPPRLDKRLVI